jgi:hypothetical protein
MSQKISSRKTQSIAAQKGFENVPENWILYDTVLIGLGVADLSFKDGYLPSYLVLGGLNDLPYFNVRNRNHGLAYNNQDTRDQTAWVFRIYTVGVQFFGPTTNVYRDAAGVPTGAQHTEQHLFMTELPKHASLTIQTNQDERIKLNSLMAPAGAGAISGGVGYGSRQIQSGNNSFDTVKGAFSNGTSVLTNRWGFPNPLEVPRRATLSAKIRFSEYARNMLTNMPGPYYQPFRPFGGVGSWYFSPAMCGIRVILGGQRQVQQRGQYHA